MHNIHQDEIPFKDVVEKINDGLSMNELFGTAEALEATKVMAAKDLIFFDSDRAMIVKLT